MQKAMINWKFLTRPRETKCAKLGDLRHCTGRCSSSAAWFQKLDWQNCQWPRTKGRKTQEWHKQGLSNVVKQPILWWSFYTAMGCHGIFMGFPMCLPFFSRLLRLPWRIPLCFSRPRGHKSAEPDGSFTHGAPSPPIASCRACWGTLETSEFLGSAAIIIKQPCWKGFQMLLCCHCLHCSTCLIFVSGRTQ